MRIIWRFWAVFLILLVAFVWTWTESAAVTIRVADGRCTANLYGRRSTIDCPGLKGGTLLAYVEHPPYAAWAGGPLGRLMPDPMWQGVTLSAGDGRDLHPAATLPASFTAGGRLMRPTAPGGLLLRQPDAATGWVFAIDGANRRGVWWTWADGQPVAPLQGIPLDRPPAAHVQAITRQLLFSWQGAVILVIGVWLIDRMSRWASAALNTRSQFPHVSSGSPSESRHESNGGISHHDNWARHATRKAMRIIEGSSGRVERLLLLLIILFAFALALHVSVNVLKRLPHVQDSVTYLFQAQTLARGRLFAPAPPLAAPDATPHFAQEFLLVRGGRWFGKYPPGYPALLALGVAAGGHWLVNPLLAALTVPLLWRLARALYRDDRRRPTADRRPQTADHRPQTTGLLNTDPLKTDPLPTDPWPLLPPLLLALSPFFLVMSGSLMAHSAELFWTTLYMLGWVKMSRRNGARWALLAGIAFGMLFLTRQFTAALVAISFALIWLILSLWANCNRSPYNPQAGMPALQSPLRRRSPAALLLFLATAAPFVLALPAHQAALTGDPRVDPRLLYWPYDRVGFGPGIGEPENVFTFTTTAAGPAIAWRIDPAQPPRGHSPGRGLYNLGRNLSALENTLFGWPALFTLAFLWLTFLLRRPAAADWAMLTLLLAFAGGYVAYWHAGVAYGPRYFYAALPALVILTSRGASALAAGGRRPAVALLLLLLIAYNLLTLPNRIAAYRDYNFIGDAERAVIDQGAATPALVFVAASETDWWKYGAFFSGNTPWLDGPVVYARDLGNGENSRLWAEFPGRAAYLWRDGRLTPLGASPAQPDDG